jgi:hypothetical protein
VGERVRGNRMSGPLLLTVGLRPRRTWVLGWKQLSSSLGPGCRVWDRLDLRARWPPRTILGVLRFVTSPPAVRTSRPTGRHLYAYTKLYRYRVGLELLRDWNARESWNSTCRPPPAHVFSSSAAKSEVQELLASCGRAHVRKRAPARSCACSTDGAQLTRPLTGACPLAG